MYGCSAIKVKDSIFKVINFQDTSGLDYSNFSDFFFLIERCFVRKKKKKKDQISSSCGILYEGKNSVCILYP